MTTYSHDPNTGRSTKTVYSPLFSSDSFQLAEGAEFRASVVNTRRVEPISYTLLASVGGLTLGDLDSKATAVIHFKNDSQETYQIILKKFRMHNQEFAIRFPEIILKPGDRYDTKSVPVKIGTYDTEFGLELDYELNGKPLTQQFPMLRQTMDQLKKKPVSSK